MQQSQTFIGRSRRTITSYSRAKIPTKAREQEYINNLSKGSSDHVLLESTNKSLLKGDDNSEINTSAIRTHHPKEGIKGARSQMRKPPRDKHLYSYVSKQTNIEYTAETCLAKKKIVSGESYNTHQRSSVMHEVSNLADHHAMYEGVEYRLNALASNLDDITKKLLHATIILKEETLDAMKKIDGHSETLSKILRDSYNKKPILSKTLNRITYDDYLYVNQIMKELNTKKEQYRIPSKTMLIAKRLAIESDKDNIDLNERAVAVYKVNRLLGKNIRPRIKQREIEGLLGKLDTHTRSGAVPIPRGSIDTLLDNI